MVVCRQTFLLLYCLSVDKLKALQKHVREKGVVPRVHGNTGRKPAHAISYDDVLCVVRFIQNTSNERGIPQPAAPRGIDNFPLVYLSAETTKLALHEEYSTTCTNQQVRALRLTAFKDVWRTCLPHVRIASPRDDVCATCEKMRHGVMDAITEEEKLLAVDALKTHILQAQREREVYNECLRKSSEENFVHFTFDFSQSVTMFHHARQM
ncbi:uncharacterized protein LOC127857785 [Dreissena polymorpha]|uniref:uncharacterized protein LOC127857785 n=1 Tax=Dreissena polymorpha TaxID=45954 RepID=UPI00226535E1|nr:uncharacterized protein LOC127857785 [Dreissena polymorpha]